MIFRNVNFKNIHNIKIESCILFHGNLGLQAQETVSQEILNELPLREERKSQVI